MLSQPALIWIQWVSSPNGWHKSPQGREKLSPSQLKWRHHHSFLCFCCCPWLSESFFSQVCEDFSCHEHARNSFSSFFFIHKYSDICKVPPLLLAPFGDWKWKGRSRSWHERVTMAGASGVQCIPIPFLDSLVPFVMKSALILHAMRLFLECPFQ